MLKRLAFVLLACQWLALAASADHGVAADHQLDILLGVGNGATTATPSTSSELTSATSAVDALVQFGQSLGGDEEFLDPDTAFVLSTSVNEEGTLVARWDIAEGYYLYRKRFKFNLTDADDVSLGAVQMPAGKMKEDAYFGLMEVYYSEAVASMPLTRVSGAIGTVPREVLIDVSYQGCADAGLCYPPITKSVPVMLPASFDGGAQSDPGSRLSASNASAYELPEQDRIARSLAEGSTWLVLLGFFGFGLLLTFTPCVFPMIPILSSIIVGQSENLTTRRAFTLSLAYVLPMAVTYTVAGVLAGLFGANLQSSFQNPWILGTFSAVFVLLALSMFGFYDLQIPAGWQARLARLSNQQERGTYLGVGLMGFFSALIIGPCVAAPLAGALIYIGQTGDAVLGGMALFALSLGMGAPVLALGTSAGTWLPKAGPWMSTIKSIFGVLLLAVAVYLLERVLPAWISMLLWAALLIVAAIYMGALDSLTPETGGWRRLWKGSGLVMMVYGVLLMVGASGGGGDVFQPLKGLTVAGSGQEQTLAFKRVKGPEGLRAEVRAAAAKGQSVMLDFYADWCVSCKELERYTFSDPRVQAALADTVLLQTDVTANDERDQALLKSFGLYGPPAILFFGPDGKERPAFRVVGFMKAEPFRNVVERATADVSGAVPAALTAILSQPPTGGVQALR